MKNITDAQFEDCNPRREMPTVGEFVSAKMTDAFSSLGESFGKQRDKLALKKDLYSARASLETKAKAIGRYVVDEVSCGNENIVIPAEYIENVRESLEEIEILNDRLNEK